MKYNVVVAPWKI